MSATVRERERLLSVDEAATLLNISRYTLYEIARCGLLPPGTVVRIGRRVRFNADALDRLIAEGGVTWPRGWRK